MPVIAQDEREVAYLGARLLPAFRCEAGDGVALGGRQIGQQREAVVVERVDGVERGRRELFALGCLVGTGLRERAGEDRALLEEQLGAGVGGQALALLGAEHWYLARASIEHVERARELVTRITQRAA